jgi:hypothetical protein
LSEFKDSGETASRRRIEAETQLEQAKYVAAEYLTEIEGLRQRKRMYKDFIVGSGPLDIRAMRRFGQSRPPGSIQPVSDSEPTLRMAIFPTPITSDAVSSKVSSLTAT